MSTRSQPGVAGHYTWFDGRWVWVGSSGDEMRYWYMRGLGDAATLREEMRVLREKWRPYEELIASVKAMPPSHVEKRGR